MTGLAKGIAHVSFAGGGAFLPARSPYDRQVLAEHVVDRLHTKGRVQVLLDEQRWLVQPAQAHAGTRCAVCDRSVNVACYAPGAEGVAYCAKCALGYDASPVSPRREPLRQVS